LFAWIMSHISFYLHILKLLMILDRYENHVVFRNPSWCVRGCHTSLTTKLRWRKGRSTISPRIWEVSRTRKLLTMPIYRLLFFCPLRSSFSLFVVIVNPSFVFIYMDEIWLIAVGMGFCSSLKYVHRLIQFSVF
jgi:hypothetical protein